MEFCNEVNLVLIEPVYVSNELVLSLVAIEFISDPVAFASSVWFTYVVSNDAVKLSKLFNLLFVEDVNVFRDEVILDSVVNLVSTEPV